MKDIVVIRQEISDTEHIALLKDESNTTLKVSEPTPKTEKIEMEYEELVFGIHAVPDDTSYITLASLVNFVNKTMNIAKNIQSQNKPDSNI